MATLVVWERCPHCQRAQGAISSYKVTGITVRSAFSLPPHARPTHVPFLVPLGSSSPLIGTSALRWLEQYIRRNSRQGETRDRAIVDGIEAIGSENGPPEMLVEFATGLAVHKDPFVEADAPMVPMQPSADIVDRGRVQSLDIDRLRAERGYG